MIWRYHRYTVVRERVATFNEFFRAWLLPVQQEQGATLIGRWQSEDRTQIVAIWAYASKEQYEAIQARVAADPRSVEAQRLRHLMPEPLFVAREEWFMDSTVGLEHTALAHLTHGSAGDAP